MDMMGDELLWQRLKGLKVEEEKFLLVSSDFQIDLQQSLLTSIREDSEELLRSLPCF
jgi:hypothetical protein